MAKSQKVVDGVESIAKKLIPETAKDRKVLCYLLDAVKNVHKVILQSEAVNAGNEKITDCPVDLVDPEARPIVKGKFGKSVEFGYKLQIQIIEGDRYRLPAPQRQSVR